jgi:hypothetical protein
MLHSDPLICTSPVSGRRERELAIVIAMDRPNRRPAIGTLRLRRFAAPRVHPADFVVVVEWRAMLRTGSEWNIAVVAEGALVKVHALASGSLHFLPAHGDAIVDATAGRCCHEGGEYGKSYIYAYGTRRVIGVPRGLI